MTTNYVKIPFSRRNDIKFVLENSLEQINAISLFLIDFVENEHRNENEVEENIKKNQFIKKHSKRSKEFIKQVINIYKNSVEYSSDRDEAGKRKLFHYTQENEKLESQKHEIKQQIRQTVIEFEEQRSRLKNDLKQSTKLAMIKHLPHQENDDLIDGKIKQLDDENSCEFEEIQI